MPFPNEETTPPVTNTKRVIEEYRRLKDRASDDGRSA
jgi:hypothetical protein